MIRPVLSTLLVTLFFQLNAQELIPLYRGKIPNSKTTSEGEVKSINQAGQIRYAKVIEPTLEVHIPEKKNLSRAAVIIIPGGGYSIVSYTNEGTDIAKAFNNLGITAFILKYRLPSDKTMEDKSIGPLQDAQQAIKLVRMQASKWNIDTAKIGIIGFSAGGHLASTAGTHFDKAVISNAEMTNLRPSFMILMYPVISLTEELMHKGSKNNLIGESADSSLVMQYSNETQVSERTPPTILIHAGDDKTVKVGNSILFYQALQKCSIPAELHIYPNGGHGFGINNKTTHDKWIERVENWLKAGEFIQ